MIPRKPHNEYEEGLQVCAQTNRIAFSFSRILQTSDAPVENNQYLIKQVIK
jgi:hypothetical protein